MASTTTNLGLTKPAYSDDADISDINGNMDLIDAEAGKVRANVAANYDSSEAYAVGDYCLHDGSLYKCTTAISSPESWTAGHWTQIKIAGELSSLSDQIANVENSPISGFGFYKNGKIVCVTIVKEMTTTDTTDANTIPVGFRPRYAVRCLAVSDNGQHTARVFFNTNGRIEYQADSSNTYYGSCAYFLPD